MFILRAVGFTGREKKMEVNDIKPTGNMVLIKTPTPKKETDGGVLLPQQVYDHELRLTGEVIAVGPGKWNKSGTKRIPLEVSVGDRVHIARFSGRDVWGLPEYHLMVRDTDILAILGDDSEH